MTEHSPVPPDPHPMAQTKGEIMSYKLDQPLTTYQTRSSQDEVTSPEILEHEVRASGTPGYVMIKAGCYKRWYKQDAALLLGKAITEAATEAKEKVKKKRMRLVVDGVNFGTYEGETIELVTE